MLCRQGAIALHLRLYLARDTARRLARFLLLLPTGRWSRGRLACRARRLRLTTIRFFHVSSCYVLSLLTRVSHALQVCDDNDSVMLFRRFTFCSNGTVMTLWCFSFHPVTTRITSLLCVNCFVFCDYCEPLSYFRHNILFNALMAPRWMCHWKTFSLIQD